MTHTYRHTDRHTHTLGSIATYSVKMTEYKKERTWQKRNKILFFYRRSQHDRRNEFNLKKNTINPFCLFITFIFRLNILMFIFFSFEINLIQSFFTYQENWKCNRRLVLSRFYGRWWQPDNLQQNIEWIIPRSNRK